METEFQNAVGKSAGEIARDVAEFLSLSCTVTTDRETDLRNLLPDLNMREQFTFALFSEAVTQGWEPSAAENFCMRVCAPYAGSETVARIAAAFRDPDGETFAAYRAKYGSQFSVTDGSYWGSCLALAISAGSVGTVLHDLRLFTVCLTEFAYMDDKNPETTYAWEYYETFRKILDDLTAEPEKEAQKVLVRAIGGTAGKREKDSYLLSLGVDLQNPNPDRMAWNVSLDITLKDAQGNVISVIKDTVACIDPGTVFHYGVTRRVRGAATAGLSAVATADHFSKLTTPIMRHIALENVRLHRGDDGTELTGTLRNGYDVPIRSMVVHYQFLNEKNRILGGGSEWLLESIEAGAEKPLRALCPVPVKGVAKLLYSVDFNAQELV